MSAAIFFSKEVQKDTFQIYQPGDPITQTPVNIDTFFISKHEVKVA